MQYQLQLTSQSQHCFHAAELHGAYPDITSASIHLIIAYMAYTVECWVRPQVKTERSIFP
jgi:hypothetical protein